MRSEQWLSELVLEGQHVILRPLVLADAQALVEAAKDGELWNLWFTGVPNVETVQSYVEDALAAKAQGVALPFVVVDKATQAVIGSTRFCNADNTNQRVEIGYTWYAKRFQKTLVNTECKYLLLSHAFEKLSAIAIEFRTHWHNQASRKAIARLGAKQDGVLRNHQRMDDGSYRDTVVFSITESEWLAVKASLSYKLNGG